MYRCAPDTILHQRIYTIHKPLDRNEYRALLYIQNIPNNNLSFVQSNSHRGQNESGFCDNVYIDQFRYLKSSLFVFPNTIS